MDGRTRKVSRAIPRVVFNFTITDGKFVANDMLADSERLRELDLTVLKK